MENKKLFIGNLDFAVTEEEVKTLLSDYGTVVNITMHKKKGYAFAEMSDEAEAALAIEKLNGTMFKDREVRISLELKAKKAKALSIKRHDERTESFSRNKKSRNPDNGSRKNTGRDSEKKENGRSSGPETNYNSREKVYSPDDRPARNFSRGRSDAPRPQRKEWSHDKPSYSQRPSRDGRKPVHGRSPKHDENYNSREKIYSPDDRPARNFSRGRSDAPHPQRKEWSHDKPSYSQRPSRDGRKSGNGRSPENETNYNSRERFPRPEDRPARDYTRGRSDAPHPQRKEWSHDKPASSHRHSGPSKQPGARTRDVFKPRQTRSKSGPGGENSSANSERPKARGGAGNRDRNSRQKKD